MKEKLSNMEVPPPTLGVLNCFLYDMVVTGSREELVDVSESGFEFYLILLPVASSFSNNFFSICIARFARVRILN